MLNLDFLLCVWRYSVCTVAIQEVLTQWGEDVNQHYFFIHHRCAMPAIRREVEYIAGCCDLLVALDKESHFSAFDDRHLLVRMIVFRGHEKWLETKATDHHPVTYKHLSLDSIGNILYRNRVPVKMLWKSTLVVRTIV
jgi:hypothetical protein